jgi:GTP-binding protein HflX
MRAIETPSGKKAILSDTVGFISQLPHELVSAFQATLEEVIEADIIVHVRDAAHADREAQKSDVLAVLRELGFNQNVKNSLIEVFNKADLLDPAEGETLANQVARSNTPAVLLSAATGEGCETLTAAIDTRITENYRDFEVKLPHDDGASLAWLYDHANVIERRDKEDAVHLTVRIDEANWARFQQRRG